MGNKMMVPGTQRETPQDATFKPVIQDAESHQTDNKQINEMKIEHAPAQEEKE